MIITDKTALKELKRTRSYELNESVSTYPEDERDGQTDLQIVFNECAYIIDLFEEDGTCLSESLEWAREVLRATKNGKCIPVYVSTLQPIYRPREVEAARNVINEYRRLKSLLKRLKANPEIW